MNTIIMFFLQQSNTRFFRFFTFTFQLNDISYLSALIKYCIINMQQDFLRGNFTKNVLRKQFCRGNFAGGDYIFIPTIISLLLACVSLISLIVLFAYWIGHASYLHGFENSRETFAIIKEFRNQSYYYKAYSEPMIEYYNEFTEKKVMRIMENTKINSNNSRIGDTVKIQYTATKERIIDQKYTAKDTNSPRLYGRLFFLCITLLLISLCLLIACIFL